MSTFEWFSFGRGLHGELGRKVAADGSAAPGLQNADVAPLALAGAGPSLAKVSCGQFHCLGVSTIGEVIGWGANAEGQLGITGELGEDVFVSAPAEALQSIRSLLADEKIVDVAAGRSHSVFVSAPSGRCFAAGSLPVTEPGRTSEALSEELREIRLVDGTGSTGKGTQGYVVSCSAGESTTLFTTSEGEVWSWLDDAAARCARGLERPTARVVLGLPKVKKVACGWHHTLALTDTRCVFAFGAGSLGQLGLGSCRNCPAPTQVPLPSPCDGQIVGIAAGFSSSFVVTWDGGVYAWGANDKCQLGLGASIQGTATAKLVEALSHVQVLQVAAGFSHAACRTATGLLYLWGFGSYGQLGFEFNDVRASLSLGIGGRGGAPLASAGDAPRAAYAGASGGARYAGHSRPWMQVWPRRCKAGPFSSRHCIDVGCGAHHTLAKASQEPLDEAAASAPDVLAPPPMLPELSAEEDAKGGGDYGSSSAPALGAGASSRESQSRPRDDAFQRLAGLFWNTAPCGDASPSPEQQAARTTLSAATDGDWRRALVPSGDPPAPPAGPEHPLLRPASAGLVAETALSLDVASQIPDLGGPNTWDAVDQAVHLAFANGSVADTSVRLDLAELAAGVTDASPPKFFADVSRELPPSPCRGLARTECLTPRPFYRPILDETMDQARAPAGGAPAPAEEEQATADARDQRQQSDDPAAVQEMGDRMAGAAHAAQAAPAAALNAPDSPP